jgi:nucleoside-diphosphate-sugar epimerase
MKRSLFITGASGFIGRQLLSRLNSDAYEYVYCLSRTTGAAAEVVRRDNLTWIKGDLLDDSIYSQWIALSDTVIHLAAVTGKARPEDYFRVNVEGTARLLRRCVQSGVRNFLYVSSIAAGFEASPYHYAESKRRAEALVKDSGLKYTIVRPTMVIGRNSPILGALSRLVDLPLVPVFGDGHARVQPVDVGDLADILLSVAGRPEFTNQTIDCGGPEILTIEDFMRKLSVARGRSRFKSLHFPLKRVIPIVSFIEKRFFRATPFTVGQLSTFIYDGIAEHNGSALAPAEPKGVDEMLRAAGEGATNPAASSAAALDRECRLFCRYLVGQQPTRYVVEKYRDGNERCLAADGSNPSRFDVALVRIAGKSRLFTKLVDSYTSVFFKGALAKKKLVLLLAILESSPPTDRYLDSVDSPNKLGIYFKMGLRGMVFVLALVLSAAAFLPLRIVLREGPGSSVHARGAGS